MDWVDNVQVQGAQPNAQQTCQKLCLSTDPNGTTKLSSTAELLLENQARMGYAIEPGFGAC